MHSVNCFYNDFEYCSTYYIYVGTFPDVLVWEQTVEALAPYVSDRIKESPDYSTASARWCDAHKLTRATDVGNTGSPRWSFGSPVLPVRLWASHHRVEAVL